MRTLTRRRPRLAWNRSWPRSEDASGRATLRASRRGPRGVALQTAGRDRGSGLRARGGREARRSLASRDGWGPVARREGRGPLPTGMTGRRRDRTSRWYHDPVRPLGRAGRSIPGAGAGPRGGGGRRDRRGDEEAGDADGGGRGRGRERAWKRRRLLSDETRHVMTGQLQRVGASLDWSRERFTMDEGSALAVRTAFKRLYDDGPAYRAEAPANWCPTCPP